MWFLYAGHFELRMYTTKNTGSYSSKFLQIDSYQGPKVRISQPLQYRFCRFIFNLPLTTPLTLWKGTTRSTLWKLELCSHCFTSNPVLKNICYSLATYRLCCELVVGVFFCSTLLLRHSFPSFWLLNRASHRTHSTQCAYLMVWRLLVFY